MYSDDATRIPANEVELWDVLWEQFEFVRHVLWELELETGEEALAEVHHKREDGTISRVSMGGIRYRDTGDELDQRDYYWKMGRELLPYIHQALDEKKLTPEFVQQWGKIMFCHGYLASYVFDDTDDLLPKRNRIKGTRATKRTDAHVFLARLLLWFMDQEKQTPAQAEASAAKAIQAFISSGDAAGLPASYDLRWLRSLLFRGEEPDRIISTMRQRKERGCSAPARCHRD